MSAYSDALAPLTHIDLEDSWVLALSPSDNMLAFDLEAVLTEGHPDYQGPKSGEQYYYRLTRLTLGGAVSYMLSGARPSTNASGEGDLGNLDSWTVDEDGVSMFTGDWGEARVSDARVEFVLA